MKHAFLFALIFAANLFPVTVLVTEAAPPKSRGSRTIPGSNNGTTTTTTTSTTSTNPAPSSAQKYDPELDSNRQSNYTGVAPSIERRLVTKRERLMYLFGGLDLGFSNYSAYNELTEGSRSGFHSGVRGLFAFYLDDWVLDAGLGWQFAKSVGTNPDTSKSRVITRGTYLEFSPRYRFGENWQVGPIFNYWLTTDNGLNPDIRSPKENSAFLAGIEALYEWDQDNWKYRIGGRALTDLNITGRTFTQVQALFQIGFPMLGEYHDRLVSEDYVR